jgi:hypothetical protein
LYYSLCPPHFDTHCAQELQVFLTREEAGGDGQTVVARLGPVLQELQLITSLGREEVKALLQRVAA